MGSPSCLASADEHPKLLVVCHALPSLRYRSGLFFVVHEANPLLAGFIGVTLQTFAGVRDMCMPYMLA